MRYFYVMPIENKKWECLQGNRVGFCLLNSLDLILFMMLGRVRDRGREIEVGMFCW